MNKCQNKTKKKATSKQQNTKKKKENECKKEIIKTNGFINVQQNTQKKQEYILFSVVVNDDVLRHTITICLRNPCCTCP